MDVRKINGSVKGKPLYTRARSNQQDEMFFPAIRKTYCLEKQTKTDILHHRSLQQNKSTLNQVKSTFRLPRINVKRESFSVCKKCHSHFNCASTRKRSTSDNKTSSLNALWAKKLNSEFQDASKLSKFVTDLSSCQKLLKSLRIVDLEMSKKEARFHRENSLKICRMELIPRRTIQSKNNTVKKQPRTELQVTYPTLQLSSTDKNAIFSSSPSPCWSMESLDSIVGGSLTLTQPPPDIMSSCSPSEIEFTPPSTP